MADSTSIYARLSLRHNICLKLIICILSIIFISGVLSGLILFSHQGSFYYNYKNWQIDQIHPAEMTFQALQSLIIVDTRSAADFEKSHIPQAISFPVESWNVGLDSFLEVWSPEKHVLIYCGGQACGLSKQVAIKLLIDLPDAKISVLKGGFPAWQANQAQLKPNL